MYDLLFSQPVHNTFDSFFVFFITLFFLHCVLCAFAVGFSAYWSQQTLSRYFSSLLGHDHDPRRTT